MFCPLIVTDKAFFQHDPGNLRPLQHLSSIFFLYLINTVLMFEILQIFFTSDQHYFVEFSRVDILESRDLFSITDAAVHDLAQVFFVVFLFRWLLMNSKH